MYDVFCWSLPPTYWIPQVQPWNDTLDSLASLHALEVKHVPNLHFYSLNEYDIFSNTGSNTKTATVCSIDLK